MVCCLVLWLVFCMNINENTSGVFRWLVPVSKDLGGGTLSTKCHSSFEF